MIVQPSSSRVKSVMDL